MNTQVKTSNGWKDLSEVKLKTSNGWNDINTILAKTSDGWKEVWSLGPPGASILYHFELPQEANGLYVADEIIDGVPYYKGSPVI